MKALFIKIYFDIDINYFDFDYIRVSFELFKILFNEVSIKFQNVRFVRFSSADAFWSFLMLFDL
jgi:hypothetical protein